MLDPFLGRQRIESSLTHIRKVKVGAGDVGAPEFRADKNRRAQTGAFQDRTLKLGIPKIRRLQVRPGEVGRMRDCP